MINMQTASWKNQQGYIITEMVITLMQSKSQTVILDRFQTERTIILEQTVNALENSDAQK